MTTVPNTPRLYARMEATEQVLTAAAAEKDPAMSQRLAAIGQAMATLCVAEATWLRGR